MSGNNFFNSRKGIIFIIDLVLAVAVITFAFVFVSQVKPEQTLKPQEDLVYLEAQDFLFGMTIIPNIDINKEYLCRNYKKPNIQNQKLVLVDKNVCVNVIR